MGHFLCLPLSFKATECFFDFFLFILGFLRRTEPLVALVTVGGHGHLVGGLPLDGVGLDGVQGGVRGREAGAHGVGRVEVHLPSPSRREEVKWEM